MLNSRTACPPGHRAFYLRSSFSFLPFEGQFWLSLIRHTPQLRFCHGFCACPSETAASPKKISEQSPPNAKQQAARTLFRLEVHSLHFHSIPLSVPLRSTNAPFHFSSVHFTTNHFYIKVLQLATLQPTLICSIFFCHPCRFPRPENKNTRQNLHPAAIPLPTRFARRNIVPLNPPTGNSCTSH